MSIKFKYPVFKPRLPTIEAVLPYLREIDKTRWYTNFGPLLIEFERRLALHFGVKNSEILTAANGTIALTQTLRALQIPFNDYCAVPSWTFPATPASVMWANLKPLFLDVSINNWRLDFLAIKETAKKRKISACIIVSAFGAPINIEECDSFTQETGIPVIIDAASGFDSFIAERVGSGKTPIIVSLHATKVSGVGEGAVVISKDEELIYKIRQFGNFGFSGQRISEVVGVNSKLSEYTAAVGLAMLDLWPITRLEWLELTQKFHKHVRGIEYLEFSPDFGEGWVSSYGVVRIRSDLSVLLLSDQLSKYGIETRRWWYGCRDQPAYRECDSELLPITEFLSNSVLGLPFWLNLNDEEFGEIFSILNKVLNKEKV